MIMRNLSIVAFAVCSLTIGSQSSRAALVAYYPFDEGSGSTAFEATGFSSHASLNNGAGWTAGQLGNAADLSASNSYAFAPSYSKPTTSMTVSLWVKANSLGHVSAIMMNWGNANTGQLHLDLGISGAGVRTHISDTAGTIGPVADSTNLNTTGAWEHLGFVAQATGPTTGTLSMYRNGVSVGTPLSYNGNIKQTAPMSFLVMGAKLNDDGTNPHNSFNGSLDDVGLFNSALTAGQMKAVYNLALDTTVSTFGIDGKYDLGKANQIFTAFAAQGSVAIGNDLWTYSNSLPGGTPGDLGFNGPQTYLLLEGNSGMVLSAVPEPAGVGMGLIALFVSCGMIRKRQR